MRGVVTTGFKEATAYVRLYEPKLAALTGFRPFPGTLNLMVAENDLKKLPTGNYIPPEGERGGVRVIKCGVFGIPSAVVIPEKARHKGILEVIAPINLRNAFELKDGDEIEVEI